MKKFLTLLLTLCLVASVVSSFAVVANAEDIQVSVGQSFEWNDQSADPKTKMAWYKSNGTSPDGLWKYKFYSLNKKVYQNLVINGNDFCWKTDAGNDDYGIGMARVRQVGKNFHPGYAADVVKEFTCPSGGSIQILSTVARQNDLKAGTSANGTSFAIYVEDRLVYPEEGGGEFLTLVSSEEQIIDVTVDVKKGERVRIHIGAIGEQSGDGINMANTITYKAVNDEDAGELSDTTFTNTRIENTNARPTLDVNNQGGNNNRLPSDNDGLSVGAIVGIVIGGVAVVGIAAVVVIVLKKKKQD